MVAVPKAQGNNAVSRKEVRDFFADQKQASLFLQAFAVLQARDPKDPKSYAQVSSIHGLPNTEYDGFPSDKPDGGYCVHGQALFPSWHRPYIALLETLLIEAAVDIAKKYTKDTQTGSLLLKTSDSLTLIGRTMPQLLGLPSVLVDASVTVLAAPNAQSQTIKNPLASFAMPQFIRDSFPNTLGPLKTYKNTVRFPTSSSPDAGSDVPSLQNAVKRIAPQLRSMVRVLFDGTVTKWAISRTMVGLFAPTAWKLPSLEYIHDQVHGTVSGNGGHMGYPEVAAYDPIFTSTTSVFDLFVDGAVASKGLAPFRVKEGGNAWTSLEAREVGVSGTLTLSWTAVLAQYANRAAAPAPVVRPRGIEPVVGASTSRGIEVETAATTSRGIELDAPTPAPEKPKAAATNNDAGVVGFLKSLLNCAGSGQTEVTPSSTQLVPIAPNTVTVGTRSSVFAHFQIKKNAISGPFTVRFTVGDVHVVEAHIFARVNREMCANCIDLDDLVVGGNVSLTEAFTSIGVLEDRRKWAAAVSNSVYDWKGEKVDASKLESLKVFLRGNVVRVGSEGEVVERVWMEDVVDV
ncbi:Di-copper centre-containing protein [Rhizoclosmatium globosum]|uniref:tyrosinase n=1 Tax=Rhizoclosmatium globosum TaxID=329046 RepID=A0A1Y2B7J2_9FUNG|nr:Di-copper centre-containing protein [Rhizoclosmatium globosum]|eukprot:ORY30694.1 Di-copper centre-containing protein [Rhizoclosmatium globosum]